jgi:hypothetical protein
MLFSDFTSFLFARGWNIRNEVIFCHRSVNIFPFLSDKAVPCSRRKMDEDRTLSVTSVYSSVLDITE